MYPSLKDIVDALLKVCGRSNFFLPSQLRETVGLQFPERDPAHLSSQIQPHLKILRQAKIIELSSDHKSQKRNRPYRLLNKELLEDISANPGLVHEIIHGTFICNQRKSEQNHSGADAGLINELEERIERLESQVKKMQNKLNAAFEIFRKE